MFGVNILVLKALYDALSLASTSVFSVNIFDPSINWNFPEHSISMYQTNESITARKVSK